MSLPLPRLTASTVIKPHVSSSGQASKSTAVGPKKRCQVRAQAAVLEARPLVSQDLSSACAPNVAVPVPVSAVINGPESVLEVWVGPRSNVGLSDDSGSPCASPAATAAAEHNAGILHIGDIPLAVVPAGGVEPEQQSKETEELPQQPAASQLAPAPATPAHVVGAAAVAAAAGQASSMGQGHAVDPNCSIYMAGVAAGVAAAMVQQQHAMGVQQQQPPHNQQQPQQHYFPQQPYYGAAMMHPNVGAPLHEQQQGQLHHEQQHYPPQQQPPQQQPQQQVYYPAQFYQQVPYGYPMGPMGPVMAPGYAPYGQQQYIQQQQYYDYYHHQQQQQWAPEDACLGGSSAASEASLSHTYPSTPAPSTPLGSHSVASSALGRGASRARGDTVTVSAASSVKDAAGAVAKVLERQGSCLLVALKRAGDGAPCGATHIAAKTLAVSRFYVNARMGAAGAAGGAAARALVAAAEGGKAGAEGAAAAEEAEEAEVGASGRKEEVTFVPFQRSSRPQDSDSLGFVVFKVKADDLPVLLPPPVGQPAALAAPRGAQQQQRQQSPPAQQQQQQQEPPLLKAGATTDVNKLSNAVIRNVLEFGRVSLQLAGPAACHAAMQALAKARSRLARKFAVSIAVASAFSTEDTSGALGRATVFYRLDVLRVTGAAAEAAAAGWSAAGLAGLPDADGAASSCGGFDGGSSCGEW